MNLFVTGDKEHYRRWLNILPGLFIPGSAQFLSSRRRAGVAWFMLSLLLDVVVLGLLVCPHSTYAVKGFHWFDIVCLVFQIGLMIDACRRPIPRLGFKGWAAFFGLFLLLTVVPALMVRQFVVQPFKIPTGAMQPTLYGITIRPPPSPTNTDVQVNNLRPGEGYVEVKATVSGQVEVRYNLEAESTVFYVSGKPHRIRRGLKLIFSPGDYLTKGQTMAAGFVKQGDHILVNKAVYWFGEPQRGDIVVFSTDGVNSPVVRKHTYFVKRIVGLPGENISIQPPYILANGNKLLDPPILKKISEAQDGYTGYCFATSTQPGALLTKPEDHITLGADEYLLFGDNTQFSLDSRYFGPIKRSFIVGKVVYIYAPADRKGRVE